MFYVCDQVCSNYLMTFTDLAPFDETPWYSTKCVLESPLQQLASTFRIMSFASVNTIHPPTAVHLCASACLQTRPELDDSSPPLPNLVIIRGNVLEILSVRQDRRASKLTSGDEPSGLASSVAGAVLEVVGEYR